MIQTSHMGYPVRLWSLEPWTGRRVPLWSSEVPFSLCSLSGPLSRLAPVIVTGSGARCVAELLGRKGFENVTAEVLEGVPCG